MIDDFRMLSLFFFISRWDFRMVSKQSRTWIEEKDYEFDIWLNLRPSRYYGHISCGIYVHYVICSSRQCMFKLEIENDWWLYIELHKHLRSIFSESKNFQHGQRSSTTCYSVSQVLLRTGCKVCIEYCSHTTFSWCQCLPICNIEYHHFVAGYRGTVIVTTTPGDATIQSYFANNWYHIIQSKIWSNIWF